MSQPFVQFRGVSVRRGGRDVVDGLSLEVAEGETLVLLGRSGSGKTTTLRLVNRLLEADRGEILVAGRAVNDWDPIALRRRTGYVIQEIGLFPHMSVEDNVALVPTLEGRDRPGARARAAELLALVGLDPGEFRRRHPHQLSGGQRQRVGIARALAADPPLLLLDEPFGALDPLNRSALQREFRSLCRRLGKTALLVTHDVREALLLADRIALLAEGRPVFLGSPAEFRGAAHPEARAFLETLEVAA